MKFIFSIFSLYLIFKSNLVLVSFFFLILFNSIYIKKTINDKYECLSRNIDHIKNFDSNYFEFHKTGQFCMYKSKTVQVNNFNK